MNLLVSPAEPVSSTRRDAARMLLFLCLFGGTPAVSSAQHGARRPAGATLDPGTVPAAPGQAAAAPAVAPTSTVAQPSPLRVFTARIGAELPFSELFGDGNGSLSVRTMDTGSIALSVRTQAINHIAKPGAFADRPDGNYTLPAATANVSANGSRVACNVPKTETLTLPDGKRCIPLLQGPNGGRLYLVNTLATRQGECLLVADLRVPLLAAAAAVRTR